MTTNVTTSMTGPNGAVGSGLTLRPGRPDDAAALSDLAFRSKAFWGYSDSLMAAFVEELTVTPEMAADAVIAEVDGVLAGFHLLGPVSGALPGRPATEPPPADAGELDMLFLDPTFIGAGVGRVLFQDAMAKAIARGWTTVYIAADPQSTGFYETCGAVVVGERLSPSVPGRFLPLLEKRLGRNAGRGMGARATYWR